MGKELAEVLKKKYIYILTNSMAYGTQRFNATFIRALQLSLS